MFQSTNIYAKAMLRKAQSDVAAADKSMSALAKGVINLLSDTDSFLIFYAHKVTLDGAFLLQLIFPVMLSDHFQMLII